MLKSIYNQLNKFDIFFKSQSPWAVKAISNGNIIRVA